MSTHERATRVYGFGALISLLTVLTAGLLSSLYSVPALAPTFQRLGLDLTSLRPLHTTFAAAWIAVGGVAIAHRYLGEYGAAPTPGDSLRARVTVLAWAAAGLAVVITVPMGLTSGREYLGFHPAIALLILVGWASFAWTFLRGVAKGFWRRPAYVMMWAVACFFFLVTFAEQYAWLLPDVFADPIVDRRVQWKATGTIVGALNLMVYGSMLFVGEKLSGDKTYAQGRLAWSLFGLGLFNSFTNFGHHTYHLPQWSLVNTLAFAITLTEAGVLVFALRDLVKVATRRASEGHYHTTRSLLASVKGWSVFLLASSLLLSFPPLNSLVHGTYVVAGHAMTGMIGIDTFALLAVLAYALEELGTAPLGMPAGRVRALVWSMNLGLAGLIGWLTTVGIADGLYRYATPIELAYHRPTWLAASAGIGLATSGLVASVAFLQCAGALVRNWVPLSEPAGGRTVKPG